MKAKGWLIAVILCYAAAPYKGWSQCGGTIRELVHDTTVSGLGATGENPFNFTFPQFDLSLGTLTEVQITSRVTLTYKYDIENNQNNFRNHRMRLERYEDIYSSALLAPISMSYVTPWRPHNLQASDGVTGSGPDFMSVAPFYIVNDYMIIDETLYNTASFLGGGTISFEYNTSMFRTTDPATGATINNDESNDQITFSVKYVYCDNNISLNRDSIARIRRERERDEFQKPALHIYPNPSSNGEVNLSFHKSIRSDWQVEVRTIAGQLISRKQYFNILGTKLSNKLSRGTYIIKAINNKTQEGFVERLIVK